MKTYLILLLILLTACTPTNELEGPFIVTKVIDGDTIEIDTQERIRLSGINSPETGECYYQEAKDRLTELILNKNIYLERDYTNKDKYKRLLRYIHLNNQEINSLLTKEGFVKVYDKYASDTKKYIQLKETEKTAIEKSLGVWSCKDPLEHCLYVQSKTSKIYHTTSCKWAKKIKPENLICHTSEEQVKRIKPAKCIE
jgi:micrococcal nuclease